MQVAILCPAYTAVPVDRDISWLSGNAQVPRYGSCKPAGTSHSYDLTTGNCSAGTSFDENESESSWKLCTAERGPGVCEMLGQISRARGSQVMIETGMR